MEAPEMNTSAIMRSKDEVLATVAGDRSDGRAYAFVVMTTG